MANSNKIVNYLGLAFLVFMIGYILIKGYLLHHYFSFAKGTITKITDRGYKGSDDYFIFFEYTVDGEVYHGDDGFNYCKGQNMTQIKSLLGGKQFPVVYGTKSPTAGTMVLTQEFADKFNYTLPDSVKFYDSILTCK
jgi:hypothetical protein